ncbi:MAG: CrcB family protein, partial [Planctomycetota bacterium]
GILTGHLLARDADPGHWHHFVTVGLLGAFTTYSTFAVDAVRLYQHGKAWEAFAYLAASVVVGLAAAAVGIAMTHPSSG